MGVVYEAEHLTLGKLVAVKVLHPKHAQDREAVSRLRHEARVAGTLGHPNICAIYDMGHLDDGTPYLVLERLHGETLAQRLARVGRLEVADMVDVMLQVLSALAAAHQQGVVHRDLKPENVFLSVREGVRPIPKLLDFGISKAEDIEDTMADPTTSQAAAGTPYYMSPEQALGDRNFDARVDLWSAGVVLYEGLTGQRPFQAKNYNALLREILDIPHRPLLEVDPSLPAGLGWVVDKALAKRRDDRFLSALEFQNALRSYRDLPEEAPPKVIPIVVNERTSDVDGTHVFTRLDLCTVDPVSEDEEATPVYGRKETSSIEDECTLVDPPRFLEETVTQVPPDRGGKP
jgi:serine/threonine-protein kinase